MAQLNFVYNLPLMNNRTQSVGNGTLKFTPINVGDSISFLTINLLLQGSSADRTVTCSLGLYSLNGSTLSIANSMSATSSMNNAVIRFMSLTATSAAQNITPGTWYFGLIFSTGGNANFSLFGNSSFSAENAFPGGFIGGNLTASTDGLPASVATSDVDITGNDFFFEPMILLSA